MHDPLTAAFEIKVPLPWKTNSFLKSGDREWAKYNLATIWHKDPEKDGSDDSCGWFKRARHGDKAVLAKIIKAYEWDWDRVFIADDWKGRHYYCGYFYPESGDPLMSVSGIVLNLFFMAAIEHFRVDGRTNWHKAKRFMQKNLFEILFFAENPTDSMRDTIVQKWGDDTKREDRIRQTASCVYGWILRQDQRWYQHARWHVWHWRLQVPALQILWRFLFTRCCKCGKRFKWSESPVTDWNCTKVWHMSCEEHPPVKYE